MKPGFHDRFTVCRPKLQVHSRFPQPEPPQRQQERKGAESWGPCWQEPRRGARSGDRISLSFPSPNLPPPQSAPPLPSPTAGQEQCRGQDPRPQPRHSPPRSAPRCRRLPRSRRPPWPWRVPPLTGPEAAAAAPASLRAAGPRCSAPTAPLAVLLAAPPPAPHRPDPGRTPGRARRRGRAARRPQTRGAAAASPRPSAAAEEAVEEEKAGGGRGRRGGGAAALPPRPPAGSAASGAEARRCERRARPRSPGRPDVAGTRRRLVLPHTPPKPATGIAGASAAGAAASKAAFDSRAAAPTSSHPHTERDNNQSRRRRGRLPLLVRHNTTHTHSRTREGGVGGGRGGHPHCQSAPRHPIGAFSPQPPAQSQNSKPLEGRDPRGKRHCG